jgi:hypothetical protein
VRLRVGCDAANGEFQRGRHVYAVAVKVCEDPQANSFEFVGVTSVEFFEDVYGVTVWATRGARHRGRESWLRGR